MCARTCVGTHEQKHLSVEAKSQLKCLPQLLSTIVFDTRSLLKLEACKLATPAAQQAPGIPLPQPHQHWDHRLGGWGSKSRSSPLLSDSLLMAPSSQPPSSTLSHFLTSLDFTISKMTLWRKLWGHAAVRSREQSLLHTTHSVFQAGSKLGRVRVAGDATSGPGSCVLHFSASRPLLKLLTDFLTSCSLQPLHTLYLLSELSLPGSLLPF